MGEAVNGQVAGEFDAGAVEIEDQLAQEKGFRFHVMGISKGKVLKVVNALPMSREILLPGLVTERRRLDRCVALKVVEVGKDMNPETFAWSGGVAGPAQRSLRKESGPAGSLFIGDCEAPEDHGVPGIGEEGLPERALGLAIGLTVDPGHSLVEPALGFL